MKNAPILLKVLYVAITKPVEGDSRHPLYEVQNKIVLPTDGPCALLASTVSHSACHLFSHLPSCKQRNGIVVCNPRFLID